MTKEIKQKYGKYVSNAFSMLLPLLLLLLFIKEPRITSQSVLGSLKYCFSTLIPSLFPLMIASEIAIESGALQKYALPLTSPLSRLFGVSQSAVLPYLVALIGGYSASVSSAVSLFKKGDISKNDCESIICPSSIPSLAFFISLIGANVLKNALYGWILWMISIISALILGTINHLINKGKSAQATTAQYSFRSTGIPPVPFSKILIGAISHASNSILLICACVVFFSSAISSAEAILLPIFNDEKMIKLLLGGFEITNGISARSFIDALPLKAALCSATVGWSGLCVHFQIMALCDEINLSFTKYFIYKALQGAVNFILAYLIFSFV